MGVRSNADLSAADRGTTFTLKVPVAVGTGGEGRKTAGSAAGRVEVVAAGTARTEISPEGKENG
jgi:hypothetical protein